MVSEKEKEILEKIAKENNVSLSSLITNQLNGLLDLYRDEENETLVFSPGLYKEEEKKKIKREHRFEIVLSDEEYEYLKKQQLSSSSSSLSSYIRDTLLSLGNNRFIFQINTNDLDEMNTTISEINMHINGFLGAMRFRDDIFPTDIERIKRYLEQINSTVEDTYRELQRNRNQIRQQGRKYLEKQINTILNKNKEQKRKGRVNAKGIFTKGEEASSSSTPRGEG